MEAIGITGWTYPQVAAMTLPQLRLTLRHRGRLMWPMVEAMLDAARAEGLTDEPLVKGEPSPIQKVLDSHDRRRRGEIVPLTEKERRYGRAFSIVYAKYLGDPDAPTEGQAGAALPEAEPLPGMSPEEARAIVAWVVDGGCPDEVWAAEVLPAWPAIRAAAALSPA